MRLSVSARGDDTPCAAAARRRPRVCGLTRPAARAVPDGRNDKTGHPPDRLPAHESCASLRARAGLRSARRGVLAPQHPYQYTRTVAHALRTYVGISRKTPRALRAYVGGSLLFGRVGTRAAERVEVRRPVCYGTWAHGPIGFEARMTSPETGAPASMRNSAWTIVDRSRACASRCSTYPRAWL